MSFFEHHVNEKFVEYLHSDMCNDKGQILEKHILVPVRVSTITVNTYVAAHKHVRY